MMSFSNKEGNKIVNGIIKAIHENKQYLSDIDGAIGDGDHGINMNKGFTICENELQKNPGDLSYSLLVLSKVLLTDIGGSMGPLYGSMFRAMSKVCKDRETIDEVIFGEMLSAAEAAIRKVGSAEVGDKTLLDCLVPSVLSFNDSVKAGDSFKSALLKMKREAYIGRDSTIDLVAKVGRASRLGERSRGVLDAGATSCCIILVSIADSILELLKD